MPKKVKNKDLESCKHPNSRKTMALAKQMKKVSNRQKSKFHNNLKHTLICEKLLWFKDHLMPDVNVYAAEQADILINLYLSRFDEELKEINIKHSTGGRKNRQHANREDIIKMTQKREKVEYDTCGIELPNLMNAAQLEMLRKWDGDVKYLQNFKLCRLGARHLTSANKVNDSDKTLEKTIPNEEMQ